jgi:hypothetical protein
MSSLDVCLYGMTVLSTIHRLKDKFPRALAYGGWVQFRTSERSRSKPHDRFYVDG